MCYGLAGLVVLHQRLPAQISKVQCFPPRRPSPVARHHHLHRLLSKLPTTPAIANHGDRRHPPTASLPAATTTTTQLALVANTPGILRQIGITAKPYAASEQSPC
ncbi:uncharacterized protein JN550_008847 [Neoarthrinium moseri]|uniref:uncharacterized protein n=1 Tax=Neoarthrinium moseri TaxID=1658444 RepID=UPI001FDB3450|nr:uncharacterized protein JN550_008847 [Neoarthrinium moseri]KAI1864560.1 hypothetical protein JN550_008847 [Neoarthrinium moseri]